MTDAEEANTLDEDKPTVDTQEIDRLKNGINSLKEALKEAKRTNKVALQKYVQENEDLREKYRKEYINLSEKVQSLEVENKNLRVELNLKLKECQGSLERLQEARRSLDTLYDKLIASALFDFDIKKERAK